MLIPLLHIMKTSILDRGLPTLISSCEVDPAAALVAVARAHEIDRSDSEEVGWLLYLLSLAMIIVFSE